MSKVISYVEEQDVGFMEDIDVSFVSLVSHAANRAPFTIIKSNKIKDKEGNMSENTIYQLLVAKDVGEETINKTIEDLALEVQEKDEDSLEGYVVYPVAKEENVDLAKREVAAIDKDNHIYAVIAPVKEEAEEKALEKEVDYATMDNVAEALFAMADVVLGTLRQPEGTTTNKKNVIVNAIDNFRKYCVAVLGNAKSEDVLDWENLEVKGENLEELFYHVADSDKELEKEEAQEEVKKQLNNAHKAFGETVDKFKDSIRKENSEEISTKFDEFVSKFEEMKKELNESLNEQFSTLASQEEVQKSVDELKKELDDLKNTTKKRNSEVDEVPINKETKTTKKTNRKYITFA